MPACTAPRTAMSSRLGGRAGACRSPRCEARGEHAHNDGLGPSLLPPCGEGVWGRDDRRHTERGVGMIV